jgi:hypothetical protein
MNDKKTTSPEEARQLLAIVVPDWKAFWVNQGPIVRSLKELRIVIPRLSPESFQHHVNATRNDFASWTRDVIGDVELAKELEKAKTIAETIDVLDKRLVELDKYLAPQSAEAKTTTALIPKPKTGLKALTAKLKKK